MEEKCFVIEMIFWKIKEDKISRGVNKIKGDLSEVLSV